MRHLPLFPLNLVLFPGERLALHIFEPRYMEMVAYCLGEDQPFVIVMMDEAKLSHVGCTALIRHVVQEYPDGQKDIVVEGGERVQVSGIRSEHSYLSADAEPLEDVDEAPDPVQRERAITQHMRLLELAGRTVRPYIYGTSGRLSFVLAPNAALDLDGKQALLEMNSERQRIQFLTSHFETTIPRVQREEAFRRKIGSNGHFKDFPPEA